MKSIEQVFPVIKKIYEEKLNKDPEELTMPQKELDSYL